MRKRQAAIKARLARIKRRVIKIKSTADQLKEELAKPENNLLVPKKDPNAVPASKKDVEKVKFKKIQEQKKRGKKLRAAKFFAYQKQKIKEKLAIAKYRIARNRRRLNRLKKRLNRVESKLPPMPLSLQPGGKAKHAKQVLAALKKRFNEKKQEIKTKQTRSGENKMSSNVEFGDPPVVQAKNRRMLMVQNFEQDPMTGRRRLVGLSELDVSRDVMGVQFITTSDQESAPIEYFLRMKEWTNKGMSVKVDFKDPLLVGKGNDNVATSLKNMALFAPKSGAKPLPASAGTKVAAAPPQVPKGVDEEQIRQDASTAMKGLLAIVIAMIVIQVAVKGNFKDYWALFFILQLIAYCNYYDTPLPGNAEIYIQELTHLVELTFIDPDVLIRAFNPDFNKKLEVINPDAHISVWNDVKLYLLLITVFAVVVLFMAIASLIKALRASFSNGLQIIKTKFVWDYSIQFFYMAYLKLCMTVMNQIDLSVRDSYFWRENESDWAIAIGIFLLAIPAAFFLFLFKKQGELESAEVRAKYQNLYQDAALYRNKYAKYYTIAFTIRRIFFISIPMMFAEPLMQIMWFMLFHTMYMITYVAVNPHIDRKRTLVEIFNEMCLMVAMYHLAGWNGLIADPTASFDMGYSFIGLLLVTLTVNIGVIVYRTVEQWRHKRAVDLSRKLVLEQLKDVKTIDQIEAEKKAIRQKIRDEFIRKRMTEATPIPAKGRTGKRNQIADVNQTPKKGKKVAAKHMKTIAEMDENGDEMTDRKTPAIAAPINVVSAQEGSIDNQQSIDNMINQHRF